MVIRYQEHVWADRFIVQFQIDIKCKNSFLNHYFRFDEDIANKLLGSQNYTKQNKNTDFKVNLTIKAV